MHEWQRGVSLEGCVNFRDLGGYPTRNGGMLRTGQVFRSDGLHLLTAADIVRLRGEIRLGTVIDLRSSAELRVDGRGLLEREAIRFHHLPLYDGHQNGRQELPAGTTLSAIYLGLAETAMPRIKDVIATIAQSAEPVVYHCAAGKDRTGVVSALILGLLDVDDDIIVADYALTQEHMEEIIRRLLADQGYRTMLEALPPETMHAQPQTMRGFLQGMREQYGSASGYAQAAGMSEEAIRQLQQRLLDKRQAS